MGSYVITYDVGTTGMKTCLFFVDKEIELISSEVEAYSLILGENGAAEQDPEEFWAAMCESTKKVLKKAHVSKNKIEGISFCAQMQGMVLVDRERNPVRRSMSYMDQRAQEEIKNGIQNGFKIAGLNAKKLLKSLYYTGAVAASVKDPVWKYLWVKKNEPEVYKKVYKWLDVKEYLIMKCTDQFVMTYDSAFGTMLYDIREGKKSFSDSMCHMMGVDKDHMPKLIGSSDLVGTLSDKAAEELGLETHVKVFGGGGDASLIGVGAGATKVGNSHIYIGTSGWVSTVVKKRKIDLGSMIASIVGVNEDTYNYFAELETAGKCLEWVKDHLALDEINIYLKKQTISDSMESIYTNLYEFMLDEIKVIPTGSHGVIFTPWLHGNRCPFEDPNARGMFFNLSLSTGKRDLIHAVVEGICYHLRWQLEAERKKIQISDRIRFVGGGALAPITCQILADVLGKVIETIDHPQNAGAKGAAVLTAVGLGYLGNLEDSDQMIKASEVYYPDFENKKIHDKNFIVFKSLYKNNKAAYKQLNQI